jgi:ATP-dependent DNA helicase Rep
VGDDDQAIYGWRGADVKNLHQLHEDYPHLKVIQLTQNYRSTLHILRAANSVIGNNDRLYDKQLWSEHGNGDPIHILAAKDETEEAQNVVMRLLAHKFEHRTRYGDYAILYRGNHQARVFEQMLRNEKAPYVMSGGQSFFEKAEIKDLIAYMRLLTNSDDDPAFIRAATTPKRGIGTTTLEKLGEYAGQRQISLFEAAFEAGFVSRVTERQLEPLLTFCQYINALEARVRNTPVSEIMADLLKAIDYEVYIFDSDETRAAQNKWNNVLEFVGWLGKKGEADDKNVIELTQTIALITLLENRSEDETDAVRLSTIHAAKGLEFGHVFLVGAEEDILPHRESVENGTLEEERRLMYVAITRAQRSLTISYCKRRKRAGEMQSCEPSRFIGEIGKNDLRQSGQDTDPVAQRQQGNDKLANIKAMLAAQK